MEAGESEVQSHPHLHNKLEICLTTRDPGFWGEGEVRKRGQVKLWVSFEEREVTGPREN